MKRYKVCKTSSVKSVHIQGTSLTIPGLAPDMQSLLAAALSGEPLPRSGVPMYDESEEAGEARVGVGSLPPEEILYAPHIAPAEPAQPGEEPAVPASPSEEEDKHSEGDDE